VKTARRRAIRLQKSRQLKPKVKEVQNDDDCTVATECSYNSNSEEGYNEFPSEIDISLIEAVDIYDDDDNNSIIGLMTSEYPIALKSNYLAMY